MAPCPSKSLYGLPTTPQKAHCVDPTLRQMLSIDGENAALNVVFSVTYYVEFRNAIAVLLCQGLERTGG